VARVSRDVPIIYSAPMVRALIEGRKTMTRRLPNRDKRGPGRSWQLVKPGDRLWVRENFSGPYTCGYGRIPASRQDDWPVWYWADGNPNDGDWEKPRPSIHMPRWASRLTLAVTAVKVERLQAISLEDVRAEGCEVRQMWLLGADAEQRRTIAANVFMDLWSDLHGYESWNANPEVVAVSFRVIKANIDSEEARAA